MNDEQRLLLAALTHDLPELFGSAGVAVSTEARRVLDLANLDDRPDLAAIVAVAETNAIAQLDQRPQLVQGALASVFSRISLRDAEPQRVYRRPVPLPPTSGAGIAWFPSEQPDPTRYRVHLTELAQALHRLATTVNLGSFAIVYPHLLALLQRFGWSLPAHAEDVALYDHARLTAAVAACLLQSKVTGSEDAGDARLALIVGDLSGIQRYIFGIATIGAGGVARRLRARSFYLAILAEALGHQILRRLGLPLGNVLMASGGKFYLLVDARPDLATQVAAMKAEVDGWLRQQFNGELAIDLAMLPFPVARLGASQPGAPGFGALLGELNRLLAREKLRRGQGTLWSHGGWDETAFITPRDFFGSGICVSCGKFPGTETDGLCPQCTRDLELGSRLPRAAYVAFYDGAGGPLPLALHTSARILQRHELADVGAPYLVVRLNDPGLDELGHLPGSFRYLANHIPLDQEGYGLTFEQIAAQASGRRLLGYLKADVDHLGLLFAEGLQRNGASADTAAHALALSRELDLFFSGWLQHHLGTAPETDGALDARDFYTIFSGGDDLFLVGPWDRAVDLALEIHEALQRFVGGNADITLSAGILFAKERFPISRAAADAEVALERSKEHPWTDAQGSRSRNQLTLLGDTFPWERARAIQAQIAELRAHSQALTSGLLYNLVEYGRLYRRWMDEGDVASLRYKALFAYDIARNLRRGDPALYRWADELLRSLHEPSGSLTMRHLGLIATYLLFTRRGS